MKARLLVINPDVAQEPPLAPYIALESDGNVLLYQLGWSPRIKQGCLAELSEEDVRKALRLRTQDELHITPVRELPTDDLWSEELHRWLQQWWRDTAAESAQKKSLVHS
jgi:hypothetical protein